MVKADASLARKATVLAISSGRTSRPMGVGRAEVVDLIGRQLFRHLRFVDRGGCDEVRRNTVRRHLQCDVANELVQGRLGGAEGDHPGARPPGQPCAEVHQASVLARHHPGHNGFGDEERGVQLAVELAAKLLPTQIGERRDRERDEGVVHDHVDSAPSSFGLAHQCRHVVGCGYVGPNRNGFTTGGTDGLDYLVSLCGAGTIVDDHTEPTAGEERRSRRTDSPPAGAGDHRDPPRPGGRSRVGR